MSTPPLSHQAASGAAWNLGLGAAVRVAGLLGTLVLTRFIPPGPYGEVSIAAISVLTATRLLTLGLGPFVIAHASPPRETFQAFVLHTAAIATACSAAAIFRHGIAATLGVPGAARYLPGLALAAFVLHVSHIASATIVRALRFQVLATSRALGELAFTVTSVALAPRLGAAAIVAGSLSRSTIVSTLLIARSQQAEWLAPTLPERRTLRRLLEFGLPLTGAATAETAANQWDNLLVGRLFGPITVGQYALAYNLADTPAGNVAEPISDVLLPSFARIEPARRKDALLRAVGLMGLIAFPLALGLAAVATRLVDTVLDARWAAVGPMLRLLCGISVMRPLAWVVDAYLQPQKRTGVVLGLSVFRAVAVLGALSTLGAKGPLFACAAVSLAFALHALAGVAVLAATEAIPARATLGTAGRPLLAAVLMALAVFGIDRSIGPGASAVVLLVEVGAGGALYAILCTVLARRTAGDLVSLTRQVVTRRWVPEPS